MLFGDFYFSEVKIDPETRMAVQFRICEPYRCEPGLYFWASREEIFQLIADGYTVEPLPEEGPPPARRKILRAVEMDGKTYLRTDGAALPGDWLDGFQNVSG